MSIAKVNAVAVDGIAEVNNLTRADDPNNCHPQLKTEG